MNKLLLAFLFSSVALLSSAQTNYYGKSRTFKLPTGSTSADYLPNVVIVKFKDASAAAVTTQEQVSVKLKSASVASLKQKFPSASGVMKNSASISREALAQGLDRIYEMRYSGTTGIETVVNELLADSRVEYAEPSYICHAFYDPDDPGYGSGKQTYLAQVKAPEAWNIIRNASGVVIGIVDSGSDTDHEDLAANIAGGYDLIGASATDFAEDNDPNVVSSNNDHGVHVSGLASAVSGNAKGIASIASNARLFIVKVAADNDAEDIFKGYDGIKYAADHGANIINCSWGSTARSFYGEDIINYVTAKGCLVVAAGGNNNWTTPDYPAGYKGVIAVANVLENDRKSSSSNYGGYISISAPGNNIYSTTFPGTYGYKSGTSMASPLVASAAALVKSYRPELSMQQVGEILRMTADDIDNVNTSYTGMLGKGRLNVYRALTETPPSVRYTNVTLADHNNGSYLAGTTINISLDIKNYLAQAANLQVSLSSSSPYVTITNATQNAGSLSTLEEKSGIGPFNVLINDGTPDNTPVEFRIGYTANDGSYKDYETFTVVVARDFLNIVNGNISTTATSNGRVGFSEKGQEGGLGFQYKGTQLLYEASLMIGNSSSAVSDNARTSNGNTNEHFVKLVAIKETTTDSTLAGSSEFNDQGNPNQLKIDVKHRLEVPVKPAGEKFAIAEYEVINRNSAALKGVFIGMFTDWDIDDESSNATRFDASARIAYAYSTKSSSAPYAGIKLLSTSAAPAYYPLSLSDPILSDDSFTTAEKYQTLSSGIKSTGTPASGGADISFVSGYGPFTIPANSSVKVAFAYGAGDNLDDLKNALGDAQDWYDGTRRFNAAPSAVVTSYPNPVTPYYNNNFTAVINLPEQAVISLDLYNILGQKVRNFINGQPFDKGEHSLYYNLGDLNSGIYLLTLRYKNVIKTFKVSIVK